MIKRLKIWIRNIFGFSRAETNGFLILLPLILLVAFSQPLYRLFFSYGALDFDPDQARIDSLIAHWDFNPKSDIHDIVPFLFDPNTSSKKEFDSLGFPNHISDRIMNYRSKGGRFNHPNDLLKIYGLDSALFESLRPFIIISAERGKKVITKKEFSKEKKIESAIRFDLNNADTLQLKSVRGVGTILATRIVKYRNALGGFWNAKQIEEVYGLDTAVVKELKERSFISPQFTPRQLNINKATEQDFYRHPYIQSKLARTIIAYRFQHGSFKEIDDLLKIDLMDQEILSTLRPYLKVEP